MKDLKTIKKGITHSGKFHLDDVISTAFLKWFNPDISIERVDAYEGEGGEDEIVYDIGGGQFDHHQESPAVDEHGVKYCAFGLLWDAYGRAYLKANHFTNIEEAFDWFKHLYVDKMNYGDNNGYKNIKGFEENLVVIKCNPLWFEEKERSDAERKQFEKAVHLGALFLKKWTRNIFDIVEPHAYCWEA